MRVRIAATRSLIATACAALLGIAQAQTIGNVEFVNGLALPGNSLDLSSGSDAERRVGFFSDIYFDPNRNEWWGLSDRGPGGGLLPYETRVQRFTIDINAASGAISNFQIAQTIKFSNAGSAMNGMAPNPTSVLGNSFDPEGFVVNPATGNLLVSDEYGPSVHEFSRSGQLVRQYTTPANIVPRNASNVPNFSDDTGNTQGKRGNRGFEGLAISPDGQHAYAMLQSSTLDEGGSSGRYARIVKFDANTGLAVGQYAYPLENLQGRGISSLVALGNDRFLVLERNNRGIGVTPDLLTADKRVYQIDLAGATDISSIALTNSNTTTLPAGVTAVTKSAQIADLDANTLAALGGKSPEKWEGLAVGPQLANGKYVLIAGTDNDYSVTQSGSGQQFDMYFRFSDTDPYAGSIQCPIGQTTGCTFTTGGAAASLSAEYQLLPGVLHAYTADLTGYISPVPEPASVPLALAGLGVLGGFMRSRRS